jgi:hypothetical protein
MNDERDGLAEALARSVARTGSAIVVAYLGRLRFALLLPIFGGLGFAILCATAILLVAVSTALGATGSLAAALSIAWFAGSLALMFVAFRGLMRRLPDWLVGRGTEAIEDEPSMPPTIVRRTRPELDAEVARLDARLAHDEDAPSLR